MRKSILDPGSALSGPDEEVEPGVAKGFSFHNGWPVKWSGPSELDDSALPTLELIAALDDNRVAGLLLPAVQKGAAAENMPFTFYKITEHNSIDTLARIADDLNDEFDHDIVFLNPGGEQRAANMFLKMGDIVGESRDEQKVGAWSPLSDFSDPSDSDIFLL